MEPAKEISLGGGMMAEPEKKAKGKSRKMNDRTTTTSATGSKPPVYDMIGSRLRDYYDDVAKQPVPDRFMDLLMQLEAKTAKKD
jgi:Anti-sigma factor NepR